MTTAHRATYVHAKAKELSLTDLYKASTTHKRFLPAHRKLKFRSDKQAIVDESLSEAEKAEFFRKKLQEKEGQAGNDNYEQKRLEIMESTRDMDQDSSDEESDAEGVINTASESESESDDETEQLLQELERIKREKALKEAQQRELEEEEAAKNSNPLLRFSEEGGQGNEAPKRGWRTGTVFNNKRSKKDGNQDKKIEKNVLESDFHRRFLERYVR